ncbi:MAG: NB-ARC domain-containing protein [Acidimicrobiales bacterium]|nr:NB-ARC domain-containing protein [Acidimicrobiales bacterium]
MALPTGFVTLVLTDVEGSTAAWDADPDGIEQAMALHDRVVGGVVVGAGGNLLKTKGEGDSTFSVFEDPVAAVHAAAEVLLALRRAAFPLPVRVAVHAGDLRPRDGDYFGPVPNRAARLRGIASGGQVLLSGVAAEAVRDALRGELELVDLGVHELRGLSRPEHVHGLAHPDLSPVEPIAEPAPPPGNLPAPVDRFFGRDEERILLDKALRQHRFVSVVGPGGIGKSRLALQVAAEQAGDRPGGTWVVDLADFDRAEQLPLAVAAALQLEVEPGEDATAAIALALRRPALVVLDTCEAQIDAAAEFSERLLSLSASVAVLATSREPLDARGEAVLRVDPMAADDGARELFLARAAAANLGLADAIEESLVARVCEATDGVPLAIELVAGRLAVESIDEVVAALDDLEVLLGPAAARRRTGPARQRSLLDTIEWSIAALGADAREVLARLAVFANGWPDDAVKEVCAGEGLSIDDVARALDELARRSIAVRNRGDARRHRLLDTVREAVRRSLPEPPESVRDRHLAFAVALAEVTGDGANTPGPSRDQLLADIGNIRVAFAHAVATGDADVAQRLVYAQTDWWVATGSLEEGWAAATAALVLSGGDHRGALLVAAGFLALMRGDIDEAERLHRDCLALDDLDWGTRADALSGFVAIRSAQDAPPDELILLAEDAVAAARQVFGTNHLAVALNNLGFVLSEQNTPLERVVTVLEEAVEIERRADIAIEARMNFAFMSAQALNLGAAQRVLDEVEAQAADPLVAVRWWYITAVVAGERGDSAMVAEAIGEVFRLEEQRPQSLSADVVVHLADLASAHCDPALVRRLLEGLPDGIDHPDARVRIALLENRIEDARSVMREGLEGRTRPESIRAMVDLADGKPAAALERLLPTIELTRAEGRLQWERDLVRLAVAAGDEGSVERLAELDRLAART